MAHLKRISVGADVVAVRNVNTIQNFSPTIMAFGTYSLLAFFLMRLAALVNAIPSPLEQEPPPSATSASPAPSNTVPYHIVASRDSSLVDLLPWKASGFNIYLGGQTTVFCPPLGCPGGNETAFHGYGSMVKLSSITGGYSELII